MAYRTSCATIVHEGGVHCEPDIVADAEGRELVQHGSALFPIACYLLILYRYRVHVDGHYTPQLPSYPALQIIDYIVQLDHISVLRHLCMKRYYPVSRSIIMHHKVMHAEYVFVKVQYHLLKSIDKLRLRLCSKQRVYRLPG